VYHATAIALLLSDVIVSVWTPPARGTFAKLHRDAAARVRRVARIGGGSDVCSTVETQERSDRGSRRRAGAAGHPRWFPRADRARARRRPASPFRARGNGHRAYLARIARLAKGSGIHLAIASLIPASDHLPKKDFIRSHPLAVVQELNRWIKALCQENGYVFIEFYPAVADQDGKLRRDFTEDGLHCNAAGFAVLKPLVEKALTELR